MGFDGLDCVSVDKLAFCAALSVSFKDIDIFDVVLRPEDSFCFDGFDGVDY